MFLSINAPKRQIGGRKQVPPYGAVGFAPLLNYNLPEMNPQGVPLSWVRPCFPQTALDCWNDEPWEAQQVPEMTRHKPLDVGASTEAKKQ